MIAKNSGKKEYSVREAKKELKAGLRAYYVKDSDGEYFYDPLNRLPFYLEGPPGVGKTESVKQIADEMGIGFVSFSVTHHTRNSMIGLPVIEDLENGKKYTEYTMSEIIAAVERECEKGKTEGILLLDEFNCVSETILPIMLAFLQTRNIGLYTLPEGWSMVLCGNPVEYNSSAKRFAPAIMDRVRYMEIVPDADDFLAYAEEKNFHRLVLEYLKLYPHNMYKVVTSKGKEETVTTRGWENLSRTIKAYEAAGEELTQNTVRQFIKSTDIAEDFWKYFWMHHHSFTESEMLGILDGKYDPQLIDTFNEQTKIFGENALDILEKGLIRNLAYETAKMASKRISRVFDFFEQLEDGESLCEKFFTRITENKELREVMIKVKNERYLSIADKMYGIAV